MMWPGKILLPGHAIAIIVSTVLLKMIQNP